VRERYLALPANLPERVTTLATTIAGGERTTYDRVKALERALRTLPYDEQVAPPPAGRDVVDYFLFEGKRGYCEYFASAMVVMARSLGIPARVATGYAPGEPIAGGRLVRERQAHAWAEVYFAGHGWVAFEPTPAQVVNVRGEPATEALPPPFVLGEPPAQAAGEGPNPSDTSPVGAPNVAGGAELPAWVGPLARAVHVMVLLGLAVVVAVSALWWHGLQGLAGASRWYGRLHRLGRWAGIRPAPAATPLEFARVVGSQLPPAAEASQTIADLYVQERYAGRPLTIVQTARARRAWRVVRGTLVRRLLTPWQRPREEAHGSSARDRQRQY
jgi:hypothetical protein